MRLLAGLFALLALFGCTSTNNQGLAQLSSGQHALAEQTFLRAWNQERSTAALNNIGVSRLQQGDRSTAVSYFTLAARFGESTAIENLQRLGEPVPIPDLANQPAGTSQGWEVAAMLLSAFADGYTERRDQLRAQRPVQQQAAPRPQNPLGPLPTLQPLAQRQVQQPPAPAASPAPAGPRPLIIASVSGCECRCIDGVERNVCSSPSAAPKVCGFKTCLVPPARVAPASAPPVPPAGATSCTQRQVFDHVFGDYYWQWVCQ